MVAQSSLQKSHKQYIFPNHNCLKEAIQVMRTFCHSMVLLPFKCHKTNKKKEMKKWKTRKQILFPPIVSVAKVYLFDWTT